MTAPNPNVNIVYRGYRITGAMAGGFVWTDEAGVQHGPSGDVEAAMGEITDWLSGKDTPFARGPEAEQ